MAQRGSLEKKLSHENASEFYKCRLAGVQAEHPTGTFKSYHSFNEFASDVEKLVSIPANKLKIKA